MGIRQVAQLAATLRHTRPSQLWHRARLELLRRGGFVAARARRPRAPSTLRADAYAPLEPAGHGAVCGEGADRALVLLEQRAPLRLPFDWDVPTMDVSRPLAELEVHYLDWLHALDDEDFAAFSLDWIEQNGAPTGRRPWRTSWNAYGLAIRCMNWMRELRRRGDRLRPEARAAIAAETAHQLGFLERHLERDLGGNHLLKDLTALLAGSRFFEGGAADRWARLGRAQLARELDEQVLADGLHYERSPSYHALVFLDLLECHRALPDGPLRERLWRKLHDAARPLVELTHPDGGPSLFNDGGLTKAPAAAAVLRLFEDFGGSPPAARPVFAYPDAGYFGLRGEGELLVVDCGPIGPDHLPAHGHGDLLACEWSVGGRRVLVDFGVYEYSPGAWRARSRATASHNTVTIAGADQCDFWSSFRVGRRARVRRRQFQPHGRGFELVGSHDGFRHLTGRPVHRRRFAASPGRLVIEDEVVGGAGQPVEARLLLHPDCDVELTSGGFAVRAGPVRVVATTDARVRVQEHWWCPDIGARHETRQLVLDLGAAPTRGRVELCRTA